MPTLPQRDATCAVAFQGPPRIASQNACAHVRQLCVNSAAAPPVGKGQRVRVQPPIHTKQGHASRGAGWHRPGKVLQTLIDLLASVDCWRGVLAVVHCAVSRLVQCTLGRASPVNACLHATHPPPGGHTCVTCQNKQGLQSTKPEQTFESCNWKAAYSSFCISRWPNQGAFRYFAELNRGEQQNASTLRC